MYHINDFESVILRLNKLQLLFLHQGHTSNCFRYNICVPCIVLMLRTHYKTKIYKGNIVCQIRWIAFRLCANWTPCLFRLFSQRGRAGVSEEQTKMRDNEMVASEMHALILSLLMQTYEYRCWLLIDQTKSYPRKQSVSL